MANHLTLDLGLKKNDIVFLHSGLIGLGTLEKGIECITETFMEVLSEGLLVIPTFTYSWCKGELFDPLVTECPKDVGAYSQKVWKDARFVRSSDPNFSVAALKNDYNEDWIKSIFRIGRSCFGKDSVFDHMCQLAKERDGYIILLGGAHSDAVFRTTFIHYIEEKMDVPNRYLKKFPNPDNSNDYMMQLVRFLSAEEYKSVTGQINKKYSFPVISNYSRLGEDLIENKLINIKPFGYSETRMVKIKSFCDFLEEKLMSNPDYLI